MSKSSKGHPSTMGPSTHRGSKLPSPEMTLVPMRTPPCSPTSEQRAQYCLHSHASFPTSQNAFLPRLTCYSYNNTMKKVEKNEQYLHLTKHLSFSLYLIPPEFGFSSWLSPVDLMAYFDQITTSYTNHCFSLFSLGIFKLFMPCASLCCTISLLMLLAVLLISCFMRLLSLTLPKCNQASSKINDVSS